jgi:hypothetical protein
VKRPVLVVVTSDQHANSTLGLCPPEGVQLDDGGFYKPSPAQLWTWECWEDFWRHAAAVRRDTKARLIVVHNGDAVDGDHHQTSQIISRNMEVQGYVASRVFSVPKALKADQTFMVRGTEVHVGPSGSSEEALAKAQRCERDPETQNWSSWHLRMLVNDRLLDFQHHASVGGLPWTRPGGVARLAFRHWVEHQERGLRPADVLFRSHLHVMGDSFDMHKTRAIITPAWQLKTAHAHKVAPESIADIGGVLCLVQPDGAFTISKKLYQPALPAARSV